jgi:hypothetical protein
MKYRIYVPSIAVTRDLNTGKWGVLMQDDKNTTMNHTGEFFENAAMAQAHADEQERLLQRQTALCKFGAQDIRSFLRMGPEYQDKDNALAWLDRAEERENSNTEGRIVSLDRGIQSYVIDTEFHDEYRPDYEIEIDVIERKTINVIVPGDCAADEDKAEEYARDMFDAGNYDEDMEAAYTNEAEIDSMNVEEIA